MKDQVHSQSAPRKSITTPPPSPHGFTKKKRVLNETLFLNNINILFKTRNVFGEEKEQTIPIAPGPTDDRLTISTQTLLFRESKKSILFSFDERKKIRLVISNRFKIIFGYDAIYGMFQNNRVFSTFFFFFATKCQVFSRNRSLYLYDELSIYRRLAPSVPCKHKFGSLNFNKKNTCPRGSEQIPRRAKSLIFTSILVVIFLRMSVRKRNAIYENFPFPRTTTNFQTSAIVFMKLTIFTKVYKTNQ